MGARIGGTYRYRGLKTGLVGTSLLGVLALTPAAETVAQFLSGADAPSPATGHAQVIAQGVVEFGGGPYSWSVHNSSVAIDGDDANYAAEGAGFLVVDEGALLLTGGDDRLLRLPSGEAAFRAAESNVALKALGADDAGYYAIELLPGEPADDSDTGPGGANVIEPGEGMRDVDLVRNLLDRGERMTISEGDAPALLLVTEGAVTVDVAGEADEMVIETGDAIVLGGELTIQSEGTEPAAIVAAVIGPEVEREEETGSESNPTGEEPQLPAPAPDTDGDGLIDDDEANLNTDPNDLDSDDDGLSDGDEVNSYGSSPYASDTDGDLLPDYNEVMQHGTNPAITDTDGDGLDDHFEVNDGSDPLDPNSPMN